MSEHYFGTPLPELRLILLGNIGCGKTSTADNVLNQLSPSASTASRSCQLRQGFSEDRRVTLVEAPRWFWNGGKMEDSVRKETERAMILAAPGPHAVLLLVPVNQFTEMESRVPAELEVLFGPGVLDHTLVLLTCGDYLIGRTVEEYLQQEDPGLREMIKRCGGKYHVLNNRRRQDREQVCELLQKVDNMVQKNGVYYIKTVQEKELEKRVKERKQELMESYRAHREEKRRAAGTLDRGEEKICFLQRSREEMERGADESHISVSNGLQSSSPLVRTSSFKLNSDGAVLSKLCEAQSTPKMMSTFHHRINSSEDRSPQVSPPSSPLSPVFTSSSPLFSPTFSASPSVFSSSSLSPSSSSTSSPAPELRLVLLGQYGAGKSSAGNSILGKEEFKSSPDSHTAVTRECEKKKALVEGRRVAVVDTPDWFNSEHSPDEVRAQISSCIALSRPGPHVFLLCVPLDQPAKTELQALSALETVFGPEAVQQHTLVLFTHADRLRASGKAGNNSVETYIADQRWDLLRLVEKCGDRFHVMEKGNVAELLEKVEQTVKEAGRQYYTCPAFQEVEGRVRQTQVELARQKKIKEQEQGRAGDVGQPGSERRVLHSYMQPVEESEEDVREGEIEKTRDKGEMSVSSMNIESLPVITISTTSPSFLRSVMEKMESTAKMLPELLADGSVWATEGAKKVKNSPVWENISNNAQNVQKMVVDSSVWGKVGATAGQVSKAVGDRVPKVVVDGSAWVGSGAKAAAASPIWEKVGSGAKQMADTSMRVGAGIGAGAMTVAQSPVWGKVGSGAKAGAKMVAESSAWEKIATTAKQVPKVVIGGALLGLVLGVFFGGVVGGAVGAAAGSAVSEVGRRKLSSKNASEKENDAARNVERTLDNSADSVIRRGEKLLKTE